MSEPLCRSCYLNGIDTPAQVVDHVRPISEGGSKTDSNNLQPLCNSCHNRKSGSEGHNNI
jgi:5-methylcytosine-specific restriction protein A